MFTCAKCGTEGTTEDRRQRFCSRRCYSQSRPKLFSDEEKLQRAGERLRLKVKRDNSADGCWLWSGKTDSDGYGTLRFPGGRTTHRLAWILENGPIPSGLQVLHRCDVPACCRPSHLRVGTSQDNVADRIARGRSRTPTGDAHWTRRNPHLIPRGETKSQAKLTASKVRKMRRLHAKGTKLTVIATQFGIHYQHAFRIVHRLRWAHVP
jgi:hypothetical protein